MSHPLLTNRRTLYAYACVWLGIALAHGLLLWSNQSRLGLSEMGAWLVLDGLVFNALYALLGLSLWYPCCYISPEQVGLGRTVLRHAFAALFISLIWVGIGSGVMTHALQPPEAYRAFVRASFPWRLLVGVLFYLVIASFYYLVIFAVNLKEQRLREAELDALVKEAELKSLKFQINPHFLFNSLNSIHSLTMSEPARASEMTLKLAEYLRYTLATNEKQLVPLEEELKSVRLYLDIEKVRFGDKIDFVERVDKRCRHAKLPSMVLQPLFENAIKHGVYESLEPVRIELRCEPYGDFLKASVENRFDPEAGARKGEGIGLQNIRQRLQRLYRQSDLLRVERVADRFKVTLLIPQKPKRV